MIPWRRTFYAAWVGQICSVTGFMFVMPLMPLYIEQLTYARTGVLPGAGTIALWSGIVVSAAALTMAIFSPIWGAVADRFGRKPMVLRSMLGGAVVLLLMAYARDVTDLLVLRVLQGCLTGTITANVALVSSITPEERSGYTLGMMQAAVFCGAAIGPVFGGFMAEYLGFRPAFLVAACVLLLGALLVNRFVRENFTPAPSSNEGRLTSLRGIFAAGGFVAALVVLFQIRFANSVIQPVFALFVKELHGRAEGVRAWTGCIAGFASMASAVSAGLLFGWLVNRYGHKRLLVLSTLLSGLVIIPMAFAGQVWHLFLMRVLFGFLIAATAPCANVVVRRVIHGKHLGKAYGITASVTCLGWGTAPLIGGYMGSTMGLRAPFVLTGVLLLLTSLVVARRIK